MTKVQSAGSYPVEMLMEPAPGFTQPRLDWDCVELLMMTVLSQGLLTKNYLDLLPEEEQGAGMTEEWAAILEAAAGEGVEAMFDNCEVREHPGFFLRARHFLAYNMEVRVIEGVVVVTIPFRGHPEAAFMVANDLRRLSREAGGLTA